MLPGQSRSGARYTTTLTEVEEQVLFAILSGEKFARFAQQRRVNVKSIHSVAKRVYDKLGASNRVEAMQMAITREILSTRYGYWGA